MPLIPLAYKYVLLTVALAEINRQASNLRLPIESPIQPQNIERAYFFNPAIVGCGGVFETKNFSFIFSKSGQILEIARINRFEKIPLRELQWKQSQMQSLVNTNQAYELATNWLWAISTDVTALEKKYRYTVSQAYFYPDSDGSDDAPGNKQKIVLLPIFYVKWGTEANPAVTTVIFGPTKELLSIRQEDQSFSRRPRGLLKNEGILLSIADSDFLRYTQEQCKELVERFALSDPISSVVLPTPTQFMNAPYLRWLTNAPTSKDIRGKQ